MWWLGSVGKAVGNVLPRKKRWRVFWVVVLAAVVVDQVWVRWDRRFRIGWETTRITSPLTEDGYPDYLAAINALQSQGVTRENNAAIVLAEVVDLPKQKEVIRKATFDTWGVPETRTPLFEAYGHWLYRQGIRSQMVEVRQEVGEESTSIFDEVETATQGPWSAGRHPQLAQWVGAMEPALSRLEEASRRSVFNLPLLTDDGRASGAGTGRSDRAFDYPEFHAFMRLGLARAQMRLEAGDEAGFTHDILTSLRFARLMARSVYFYMEGLSINNQALRCLDAGVASGRMGAAEAGNLDRALHDLGSLPSPAREIDGALRLGVLWDICEANRRSSVFQGSAFDRWVLSVIPLNYERTMREENELFDQIVKCFDNPSYVQRRGILERLENEERGQHTGGDFYLLTHCELIFKNNARWAPSRNDGYTASLVETDLSRLALAIRIAREEIGKYPERLEDLKGVEVPLDRFTEKPLVYRRKGEGYLLYSLGKNLKDDGGVRGYPKDDLSVEAER